MSRRHSSSRLTALTAILWTACGSAATVESPTPATALEASPVAVAPPRESPAPLPPLQEQQVEPVYSARVTPGHNMVYSIGIIRVADGSLVQTIELRNGVSPAEPDSLRFIDVDGDGQQDLVIFGGTSDGAPWFKIWRFDVGSGQFVWSRTTEPGEAL